MKASSSKLTHRSRCRSGCGNALTRTMKLTESLQTGSVPESAPTLSKCEIAKLRSSLKQNICVELLKEGNHRSFSELLSLLQSDQDRQAAVPPRPHLGVQTPLEEDRDKLETLKLHLGQAEREEQAGSWTAVCQQRLSLARYFSAPEDLWLRLHFYRSAADVKQAGTSRETAEARLCLAELYLQLGELDQARQQGELCVQQVQNNTWLDSDGQPLWPRACQTLWTAYSRLAEAALAAADHGEARTLLHRGYNVATESGDKQIEGEAAYQLGLTYQSSGDHDAAKKFFDTYAQISSTLRDADGLAKAHMAIARSLERQGNEDEMIRCLEKVIEISCGKGRDHTLAEAYLCLGSIYYQRSQYEKACEHFEQSYHVACDVHDEAAVHEAQVLVGSARAYTLIQRYSADVAASNTPAGLKLLLTWKEPGGRHTNLL